MIDLKALLIEQFKETGFARLEKDSKKIKEIFRSFPIAKFIEMLSCTTGNPEVEEDGDYFQWKKAYNIWDKESLRKFILEEGEYGI